MADKILATVEFVSRDTADPTEVLVAVVNWYASGNYPITNNGQEQIHFAVDQSEVQVINEIQNKLVDIVNLALGTTFTQADVRGCNL